MPKESGKTLVLGYIEPFEKLISECFVKYSTDCELPGLKAEVWQAFAHFTGFKLIFKEFYDIGFAAFADPSDPPNSTYVLDNVASGVLNASLALSSMQPARYSALRYTMPVYFSQNGLVAGKLLSGSPKPLQLQVFNWETVILFAIFVLIIGLVRRQVFVTFAEYINKRSRRRSLTDSVLVLLGLLLLINYNAGFRGQAASIRKSRMIKIGELAKGLSSGTIRIISRDVITADYVNGLNLYGRTVTQKELDKLVTIEKNLTEIARRLCEDERLICFEWFGGVNNLIGGRWKSADCVLEKVDTPDNENLTIRIPAGFALNRNFPKEYRDVLNEIIMRYFTGNQLDRVMRRYDLLPWVKKPKNNQFTPSMSFRVLTNGLIFYAVGCALSIAAFVVEALIPTTIYDAKNVYPIFVFRARDALQRSL
uniref:Uncharacterized protein n=1 Tax=Plectus sambesii TaxID=2011161 RepID=A0A914VA84_9BILA